MDAHYRFTVLNTELTPSTLAQWETIAFADYGKFRNQPYPYLLWEPSVSGAICVFSLCRQMCDLCCDGMYVSMIGSVSMLINDCTIPCKAAEAS